MFYWMILHKEGARRLSRCGTLSIDRWKDIPAFCRPPGKGIYEVARARPRKGVARKGWRYQVRDHRRGMETFPSMEKAMRETLADRQQVRTRRVLQITECNFISTEDDMLRSNKPRGKAVKTESDLRNEEHGRFSPDLFIHDAQAKAHRALITPHSSFPSPSNEKHLKLT